jgi:hypothetical protein
VLESVEPTPSRQPDNKRAKSKPVLAMPASKHKAPTKHVAPAWSAAEKAEMNRFLDELGPKTPPTLAERSLAAARQMARQDARESEAANTLIERRPNSPEIDPFGLELYMEALVKKLNRSAAYVKNDPRSKGVRVATVLVRLHPDGSLNSFKVLNAADQHDEIEFIRRVVEQAVPFAAFPADIQRSAKSLSLIICVMPARWDGGSFGFSRRAEGHGC